MGVEAVVFLTDPPPAGFAWLRKQHAQLSSKMRFMSAQAVAMLEGELWRRNAEHANAMARHLADAVRDIPGVEITQQPQANAIFAILPRAVADAVRADFKFYTWDEGTGEVRWMCSWDTTEDDVAAFTAALERAAAAAA
jgi:threonine aldolase